MKEATCDLSLLTLSLGRARMTPLSEHEILGPSARRRARPFVGPYARKMATKTVAERENAGRKKNAKSRKSPHCNKAAVAVAAIFLGRVDCATGTANIHSRLPTEDGRADGETDANGGGGFPNELFHDREIPARSPPTDRRKRTTALFLDCVH